ncbi:MAG: N-acetylglucosaminyl transferase [Candidatus Saccharibacteria bacterium]|nr:N-acetylglucosaminyl transferase [Candidatus Saccharibacteria bacterium]
MGEFDNNLRVDTIFAGKFRRYNHLSVIRQLLWVSVVLQNIKDLFLVGLGVIQSTVKLLAWRPDVIFTKGGFVCLPVGVAARLLHIPLVIHDSDAHPGLTNRILSRWASAIATGAPLEYYPYPKSISTYVGIPIDQRFRPISKEEQGTLKESWGIRPERPLVVVTGGGLGAKRVNDAAIAIADQLTAGADVVLISGKAQYEDIKSLEVAPVFRIVEFVSDMPSLLGAADVVVARAGATTILELAALEKPTILIPNPKLTGGHQLKNAEVYAAKQAVIVLDEEKLEHQPALLLDGVTQLLQNPEHAQRMAQAFHEFSLPDAAKNMAQLIIGHIKTQK